MHVSGLSLKKTVVKEFQRCGLFMLFPKWQCSVSTMTEPIALHFFKKHEGNWVLNQVLPIN